MKKFLALVMALAMVMSLTVVSTSAKDFTDDDSITYTEAIDVISALEIMDGYTDGSFQPNTQLNRGQAAKIICNLILGVAAADNLTATRAPFPDVPASHIFAGYISYCAQEGIISGYSDGYFRPGDTLSGYAFMKMLLGALGYDQTNEGLTGNNWTIQCAKLVQGIGLADDLDGDFLGSKTVTREEAALYALNTLKARTVEYVVPGGSFTVNGVEINQKASNASYRVYGTTWTGTTTAANDGNVDGTPEGDGYIQFAEEHFPRLILNPDERDDFKRPQHMWTYKGDKIGSYTDTPDVTYEGTVTQADIYDDLALTSTTDDFHMFIDGMPANLFYELATNNPLYRDEGPSYLLKNNGDRTETNHVTIGEGVIDENKLVGTGPGCVIECYKTGRQINDHDDYGTIVVINSYIGEVVAVNDSEGKHAATIDISPIGNDFDDATENAVLNAMGASILGGSNNMGDTFKTSNFELGDIVTYNYAFKVTAGTNNNTGKANSDDLFDGNVVIDDLDDPGDVSASGSVKNVAKAESVEGEVKSYTNQESFNLAGTEYKYSKMASEKVEVADVGTNVVAYLDKQGNVLYYDEGNDNNKNYALVLDAGIAGNIGSTTYQAELLYADGSTALVQTDKQYGGTNANEVNATDTTCLIGQWVFHRTDARGRTVLTKIPSNKERTVSNMMLLDTHEAAVLGSDIKAPTSPHVIGSASFTSSATRVELYNDDYPVVGIGGEDDKGNANTANGAIRVNAATTIIVKTATSGGVLRYNVYDGVKNLPHITGKNGDGTPNANVPFAIAYSALTRENQTYARFLYIDATDDTVYTRNRNNRDIFLVADASAKDSYDIDGNHYYTFTGVVNGEYMSAINLNYDDPDTQEVIDLLTTPDGFDPGDGEIRNRAHNVLAINYVRTSTGLYEIANVDVMESASNINPTGGNWGTQAAYILPNNSTKVYRITKEAIFFDDGSSFDLASGCQFWRVENRDVNARVTASTWNAVVAGDHAFVGDRYAYLAVSLNRDNEATAIYWREYRNN